MDVILRKEIATIVKVAAVKKGGKIVGRYTDKRLTNHRSNIFGRQSKFLIYHDSKSISDISKKVAKKVNKKFKKHETFHNLRAVCYRSTGYNKVTYLRVERNFV